MHLIAAQDQRASVYVWLHHILAVTLGKPLMNFPHEIVIRTAHTTQGGCDTEHEVLSVTFRYHNCYLAAIITNNSPADEKEVEQAPEGGGVG